MWNKLTFLWNELTILWNDLTIDWNDLTWNDLTMERNDRIPKLQCLYENLMSNNCCKTAVLKELSMVN